MLLTNQVNQSLINGEMLLTCSGSQKLNSASQFWMVLMGTMQRTERAAVCERRMSMKEMTCIVLPEKNIVKSKG